MWRDVMSPGPWRQRVKHLWMPPDWQRPGHTSIHSWTVERKGVVPANANDGLLVEPEPAQR
jgi:hypothetical protein